LENRRNGYNEILTCVFYHTVQDGTSDDFVSRRRLEAPLSCRATSLGFGPDAWSLQLSSLSKKAKGCVISGVEEVEGGDIHYNHVIGMFTNTFFFTQELYHSKKNVSTPVIHPNDAPRIQLQIQGEIPRVDSEPASFLSRKTRAIHCLLQLGFLRIRRIVGAGIVHDRC